MTSRTDSRMVKTVGGESQRENAERTGVMNGSGRKARERRIGRGGTVEGVVFHLQEQ